MDAILFRRCLGLNDSRGFATQTMVTSPRAKTPGATELVDCLNLTITEDGCLEKLPPLVSAVDTGAAITSLSAGSRCLFSDGANTKEWTGGSTIVNRFPGMVGPVAHTPLDVRVSAAGAVYKSINPSSAMVEAVVGTYTGPPVSKVFSAMPRFTRAFVYNSRLYSINTADPRFLLYSEDYAYDLHNIGDSFIGNAQPCLQAGQIPNVLLTCHEGGVTAYIGSGPGDYVRRYYPCDYIPGTLYSGQVLQITGSSDGTPAVAEVYQHIFLCDNGLHTIGQDGTMINATDRMNYIDQLNSSYTSAIYYNGKYLAYGNNCCLEYDSIKRTILKRSPFGVAGSCIWNGRQYVAAGSHIMQPGTSMDDTDDFGCSFTLPYSDLGSPGTKSFEALYFTGIVTGNVIITATDQNGKTWSVTESGIGRVSEYRIKTPRGTLGNHISISVDSTDGAFRVEELRAVLSGSRRTH